MPHRNIAQFILGLNVGVEAKTRALKIPYGSVCVLPVRVARGDELQDRALVQALTIQLVVAHYFFDSSDSLRWVGLVKEEDCEHVWTQATVLLGEALSFAHMLLNVLCRGATMYLDQVHARYFFVGARLYL